jgi:beta-glucosidase
VCRLTAHEDDALAAMMRSLIPRLGLLPASLMAAASLAAPSCPQTPPPSGQPAISSRSVPVLERDDLKFRDLNRDGLLQPFEDWRLSSGERAADLLGRLSIAEKAGTMMHGSAPLATDGAKPPIAYDLAGVEKMILGGHVTSLISRLSIPAAQLAAQNNALQALAERGRFAIPILISTDPRSHFKSLIGVSVAAGDFSQWPGPLGLASTHDPELVRRFADVARQEYRAAGIHMALSPQADLATEPRWSRIDGTFGEDAELVGHMVRAYVAGFQHGECGIQTDGVAAIVKHWVGYGASLQGFDGHNFYGRFAAFPGGKLQDHIRPFDEAFAVQVAGVMPTYDVLQQVSLKGSSLEPVGAGFNTQLLTGLLREGHGFKGLILSDWAITKDCDASCMTGTPAQTPADIAMPWGVETLTKPERFAKAVAAGVDQFGGETDTEQLVEAVRAGRIDEARLNQSVTRLLELKFQLGLFDNPFVDEANAAAVVGSAAFLQLASDAQQRSLVLLENKRGILPLKSRTVKVFVHGIAAVALARHGMVAVANARLAEVAILRVEAPHQLLHPGFFFGSKQHEGSLAFAAGSADLKLIEATSLIIPTIVLMNLDRPAVLTQINQKVSALLAEFGASDDTILDVLTGRARPQGKLPFELPSSMRAVEAQRPDVAHDSKDPAYPLFFGLQYP